MMIDISSENYLYFFHLFSHENLNFYIFKNYHPSQHLSKILIKNNKEKLSTSQKYV
jgi:hypothetical protein